MSVAPVYSPICDTDCRAYLAYLAVCVENGSAAKHHSELSGGDNAGESRGFGYDFIKRIVDFGGGLGPACRVRCHVLGTPGDCCSYDADVNSCTSASGKRGPATVSSVPFVFPCGSVSDVAGSHGNGDSDTVTVSAGSTVVRGQHWERNRASRARKKRKAVELREQLEKRGEEGVKPTSRIMDALSDSMRVRVAESRARALIARNLREERDCATVVAPVGGERGGKESVTRERVAPTFVRGKGAVARRANVAGLGPVNKFETRLLDEGTVPYGVIEAKRFLVGRKLQVSDLEDLVGTERARSTAAYYY